MAKSKKKKKKDAEQSADAPADAKADATEAPASRAPATLENLPKYARSLLRVEVPVSATLAATKQQVDQITALGPGSIIQFEKSCEELLDLYVDGRLIAHGEAVKVGDKFGLRITSVVLPEERFNAVASRSREKA